MGGHLDGFYGLVELMVVLLEVIRQLRGTTIQHFYGLDARFMSSYKATRNILVAVIICPVAELPARSFGGEETAALWS